MRFFCVFLTKKAANRAKCGFSLSVWGVLFIVSEYFNDYPDNVYEDNKGDYYHKYSD